MTPPPATTPAAPPPERLRQDLAAQFPAHVLGIEEAPDAAAFLVVSKSADQADNIRKTAADVVPDAHIEVLDQETFQLLQRLQKQGLIAFTQQSKTLFRSPELEQAPAPVEVKPRTYRDEALAHLETAARKRKMAQLLAGGELYAEALSPLADSFDTAWAALFVYHRGQTPRQPLTDRDAATAARSASLPEEMTELRSRLLQCDPEHPAAPGIVRDALEAIGAIEATISGRNIVT